jgi:hypothetical protein
MRPHPGALLAVLAAVLPAGAAAQPGRTAAGTADGRSALPRVLVLAAVSADAQGEADQHAVTFPLFSEAGRIDTTIDQNRARRFEVGADVRIWKRLGGGVSLALSSSDGRLTSDVTLPYPFLFDRVRTASASTVARQSARDLRIDCFFLLHHSPHWQIVLSAGPSITWLRQELSADRFDIRYFFPFDEILVLVRDDRAETSGRGTGGHAGVSIVRRLGARVGLDGQVRWSRSSVGLDDRDGHRVSIDTGGLSLGVGVRLAF